MSQIDVVEIFIRPRQSAYLTAPEKNIRVYYKGFFIDFRSGEIIVRQVDNKANERKISLFPPPPKPPGPRTVSGAPPKKGKYDGLYRRAECPVEYCDNPEICKRLGKCRYA